MRRRFLQHPHLTSSKPNPFLIRFRDTEVCALAGQSMVARPRNVKEEEAWQLIAGRKAPPKQQYEIDHLPRALIANDLALQQHLEWETEVVRTKVSGNKQARCPLKKNMGKGGKGSGSYFLAYRRQSCHHPTQDSCGQPKPGSG